MSNMFNNFNLLKSRTNVPVSQVQFIPQFLHAHEINAVKEIAQNFSYQDARIQGGNSDQNIILRQSQIKWLEWNNANWWLYTKLMNKVDELNTMLWNFELYGINEFIQYSEYVGDQSSRGHYDWHIDVGNEGLSSNRKLTIECVLNGDYNGGEFSLLMGPSENKVKLSAGDAVVYPSFLLNKIYPVISGTRNSIVSWVGGPSFK